MSKINIDFVFVKFFRKGSKNAENTLIGNIHDFSNFFQLFYNN